MSLTTARNIGIIVLLGLVVWLVPGGGEGASFINQLLGAIFIVLMALGCGILYRNFRGEIFSLGDTWRFALYAAVGIAIVTVAATRRLFDTGAGRRGAVVRAHRRGVVHAVPRLAAPPLVHLSGRARGAWRGARAPERARARALRACVLAGTRRQLAWAALNLTGARAERGMRRADRSPTGCRRMRPRDVRVDPRGSQYPCTVGAHGPAPEPCAHQRFRHTIARLL